MKIRAVNVLRSAFYRNDYDVYFGKLGRRNVHFIPFRYEREVLGNDEIPDCRFGFYRNFVLRLFGRCRVIYGEEHALIIRVVINPYRFVRAVYRDGYVANTELRILEFFIEVKIYKVSVKVCAFYFLREALDGNDFYVVVHRFGKNGVYSAAFGIYGKVLRHGEITGIAYELRPRLYNYFVLLIFRRVRKIYRKNNAVRFRIVFDFRRNVFAVYRNRPTAEDAVCRNKLLFKS